MGFQHWDEEVLLLRTEMLRVLEHLQTHYLWWSGISDSRDVSDATSTSGLVAHAEHQSVILPQWREQLTRYWKFAEDIPSKLWSANLPCGDITDDEDDCLIDDESLLTEVASGLVAATV